VRRRANLRTSDFRVSGTAMSTGPLRSVPRIGILVSPIMQTEIENGGLSTDSLAISLRAFVADIYAKPAGVPSNWKPPPASTWTLVFDTETTTDPSQRLRFGCYQLRKGQALDEAGLFFDPAPCR
jgi:hypothetical protein